MNGICNKCGGMMNFDPYFKANVCHKCGQMERIAKNPGVAKGNYLCYSSTPMTANESNVGFTCYSSKPVMGSSSNVRCFGVSCYNVTNK